MKVEKNQIIDRAVLDSFVEKIARINFTDEVFNFVKVLCHESEYVCINANINESDEVPSELQLFCLEDVGRSITISSL